MGPVAATLFLQGAFVLLAFGWRTAAQVRATGSTGFVAHRERGAVAKAAGAALTLGLLAIVAGTVLAEPADWTAIGVIGIAAMLGGLVLCLVAQRAMGASWRIGVDPDERTDLVTTGLFDRVRNPIFTATLIFAAGSALTVTSPITVLGLFAAAAGIVAQVRLVEEPHLAAAHGQAFEDYTRRAGRFLPRLRRRDRTLTSAVQA
jgi:protein-S-isoprenylcysteine O-methyltransferase Ste14